MITIKDRGAVVFLENGVTPFDEIDSSDCNCIGREFCQIVHTGDTTPFQVEVSEDTGVNLISNGTFLTDTVWTKGAGWSIAGGVGVHTSSGGGALSSPSLSTIKASTYYKIVFTIPTYSNSQTMSVVFAGDTVKTLNSTGTYTVYWFTDAILTGTILSFTPHATTNLTIDNVSVVEMTTIVYGIKNLEGNILHIVGDGTGITYYQNTASIEVDWSGIEDGCYRIFLAEDGGNLFTAGDDGSFETSSDPFGSPPSDWELSIDSLDSLVMSTAFAQSGSTSLELNFLSNYSVGEHNLWHSTTNIAVQQNSDYIIEGYVLLPNGIDPLYGLEFFFQAVGITSSFVQSYSYEAGDSLSTWRYIKTVFNTGSNSDITIKAIASTPLITLGAQAYMDSITVHGPINIESECFKKGTFGCSRVLSWSNNENAYGFIYEGTAFEHQIRLNSKLWKPKYPKDKKEVFVDSAGNRRILTSRTKKEEVLNISEIPEYLHDAISIGVEHDNFYIDGVKYINEETDYEPNWRNSSMLAPVEIVVTKDAQDLSNSYC